MNTYEQLLRSQRSRSLNKIKNSNILGKVKSINCFKAGKKTPEVPKSVPKKELNPKTIKSHKPEIRSLNDSMEPVIYSFISSKSKIVSDLFTVLKKSKNPEDPPPKNPAFDKTPQTPTQSLEFFKKTQKPASNTHLTSKTNDLESLKYGPYQDLLELYESEKEARKHFESLNEKSNTDKEKIINQLETVKRNFEWFASQDSDEILRQELKTLKDQSNNEIERLLTHIDYLQNSFKSAQIRESQLQDQVETLNRTNEQLQFQIQKLQNELNLCKSTEMLQSHPYELRITPKSHCESCASEIEALTRSLSTTKAENSALLQKLKKTGPKDSMSRLLPHPQITEQADKPASLNSELSKRLIEQADEVYEKNKEIIELNKHKTQLYKDLKEAKNQISELGELREHLDYLMDRIHTMRGKILSLAELFRSSLNKNKALASLEDYKKSMSLIEELVRTNIDPAHNTSKSSKWKEKRNKTCSELGIPNDKLEYL